MHSKLIFVKNANYTRKVEFLFRSPGTFSQENPVKHSKIIVWNPIRSFMAPENEMFNRKSILGARVRTSLPFAFSSPHNAVVTCATFGCFNVV